MDIFGTSNKLSAIAKYSELEACALLLSANTALMNPSHARYKQFASMVARVFITGGTLHLIMDENPEFQGGAVHFAAAEAALRAKVHGMLSFFVPTGVNLEAADVKLLAHSFTPQTTTDSTDNSKKD